MNTQTTTWFSNEQSARLDSMQARAAIVLPEALTVTALAAAETGLLVANGYIEVVGTYTVAAELSNKFLEDHKVSTSLREFLTPVSVQPAQVAFVGPVQQ
mgnify:CR=1 FL=1